MIGIAFVLLLAIFGYYGFYEAKRMAEKYIKDRLEQQKEAEATIMKAIVENTAKTVAGSTTTKMTDQEFISYLERTFITWGKQRGIIR